MPIYAVEVAIVCDDIVVDGIVALALITEALGIEPETDNVTLEHGADESGRPVLLATLSVSEHDQTEEDELHDSIG